ncbi:hypothetical protein JQ604_08355 [Bradyrhizobium jicamae]|uniref:hypothetical protein n=1 Tax=Bradyrhizobium jicamae TaxID=280332 RepID=UPI001BA9B194|nr:hypothetical protein [Bradyrhizobium jicamae]MBR0752193.1 hypothetical protein [Bradyrhizobium jicamae]
MTRVDVCDEASFRASGVLDLYYELFPPHERDDPDDIVRWVLTDDVGELRCFELDGEQISYRLDSRYVILRAEGRAIGLGFFTYDHASRLIYCNYVGVHRDWRRGGMAREFYRETIKLFDSELFTDNLGVVLEVEPFDGDSLERIIDDLERSGERQLAAHDQETVRKFLRITWYDKLGHSFLVDARSRLPLSCRSPCLDPELPRAAWAGEEAGYWLMWHARPGVVPDAHDLWRAAVETIYVEILAKSLVAEDAQRRRDYWKYTTGLVADTLRATDAERVGLGSYLGPDDRPWLPRWRQLGIDLPI